MFFRGLCLLLLFTIVHLLPDTCHSDRQASVKYDRQRKQFSLSSYGEKDVVVNGKFINSINKTGWAYLQIETIRGFPDVVQAYSAGLLEGRLTGPLVQMHWTNTMQGVCPRPLSAYCARLSAFLTKNLAWVKLQIQQDKNTGQHSPFWHQVNLFLYQMAGLSDAMNSVMRPPHTDFDPMGFYLLQVDGDLEDLASALGNPNSQGNGRVLGSGSCSALIKLLPGNQDLYVAQDTWNSYQSMLRILKVYNFPWKQSETAPDAMPGGIQAFSSYPGVLMSGDDFYLLSSGMVTQETTIGNSNADLWKYVTPFTVLEGVRSVVANRLATSGSDWANIFSTYNSGTYNNQWMIVDYKRFQPGKPLNPGLLTVLEQIPGLIETADLTQLLKAQGYWPSYNSPYFEKVFNASGIPALVSKYGDWFSYAQTPRARIFRRDHVKVKDLQSMTRIMRYNDFTKDPLSACNCTPPYSGENSISARSDLNPASGTYPFGALGHRQHGGTDMKLTSFSLFRDLSFVAVGGPTWDQQPPFQWSSSDFRNLSHLGQPDLWRFTPIAFNATAIFGHL